MILGGLLHGLLEPVEELAAVFNALLELGFWNGELWIVVGISVTRSDSTELVDNHLGHQLSELIPVGASLTHVFHGEGSVVGKVVHREGDTSVPVSVFGFLRIRHPNTSLESLALPIVDLIEVLGHVASVHSEVGSPEVLVVSETGLRVG